MSEVSPLFEVMYTFSSALLYPVIILLILFIVASLVLIGEFLSEYSKRSRDVYDLEHTCNQVEDNIKESAYGKAAEALRNLKQNHIVTSFSRDAADHLENQRIPSIERLSGEYEIRMAKQLEHTKIIAVVAPMLGLMGTLIPLGPALIGLTEGNIVQLANNLMVAFATTVVGLFAGSIGHVLTQIRRRWYWQDMADIDYLLDTIEGKR